MRGPVRAAVSSIERVSRPRGPGPEAFGPDWRESDDMAEAVTITVEKRDPQKNKGTGSRVARRLRAQGRIPAIVYGHGQGPLPISLGRDDVWAMIKNGSHLAQLQVDGQSEMALVREVQWDHLGKEIIHLDFARVSADETIHTTVPIEVRGTAPGLGEGGALEVAVHELSVQCRANAIPGSIRVDVGGLHLNQGIHVRELKLPEGVTVDADPDLLLLHVVLRATLAEEAAPAEAAGQPEVISRKPEGESE